MPVQTRAKLYVISRNCLGILTPSWSTERWTVIDAKTIKVATGSGPDRGEVTFDLDRDGLVARASAPSRLYAEKGRMTPHPRHGRFWDYQQLGGRLIPIQGEIAWTLDTGEFIY